MLGAINSAAYGIQQGLKLLDGAARDIARLSSEGSRDLEALRQSSGPNRDHGLAPRPEGKGLLPSLVTVILARHAVKLNAAVLRRAEAAAGALIDILG